LDAPQFCAQNVNRFGVALLVRLADACFETP
jgi:hypothetical protein